MTKENKKVSMIAAISAVIAVAMIVCVKFIAPPCTGLLELVSGKQVFMKCHYTAQIIAFLGVLLLVNAVVCLVTGQAKACGLMNIALAVFVFVVLSDAIGIGICMKIEMACHKMAPLVKVCATAEVIAGIVMCVFGWKQA